MLWGTAANVQASELPVERYAKMCAKLIFPLPEVLDCTSGVPIPDKHCGLGNNSCETPGRLSNFRLYRPTNSTGAPDPDLYFAMLCRRDKNGPIPGQFGQILGIHVNARTG